MRMAIPIILHMNGFEFLVGNKLVTVNGELGKQDVR